MDDIALASLYAASINRFLQSPDTGFMR